MNATDRGWEGTELWGRWEVSLLDPGILAVKLTNAPEFTALEEWDVACRVQHFPAYCDFERTSDGLRWDGWTLSLREGFHLSHESHGPVACDQGAPAFLPAGPREVKALQARPGENIPPGPFRTTARLSKTMHPHEGYYGFGQRTHRLNRRGARFTNWTYDPPWGHNRSMDSMYQALPVFMALRDGLAWGIFLDSSTLSWFDAGQQEADVLELGTLGPQLEYFLILGPTPAEFSERLTRLTGRPFLPPLWSLGYHQSRWGYQAQDEVLALAREFRSRQIPLDVIHLDIDYMEGYRSFTFDPGRFPSPPEMGRELGELGVKIVTIIDPGIKHDLASGYATARTGAAENMFVQTPSGSPYIGFCWPDEAMFPDFARPEVREWWGRQHKVLLEAGVAGIWNDMNEPAIFDQPFSSGLAGHLPMPLDSRWGKHPQIEVRNLYAHWMAQASHEGQLALRPSQRPWVLTRAGFAGTQRYAAAWMGDNSSWWEHLDISLPQLMSMGLSGNPNVGVDIGGFFENCSPELFMRWMELGPFYPFMRNHTITGSRFQEPWRFGPEVEAVAKASIELRYRLLPYLYTLFVQAHETGAPVLRPMLFDFPHDCEARVRDDQAMFGPLLLVAPILQPGTQHRLVYLPEGNWHDFWGGQVLAGGHHVVEGPPGRIPLFVRGGAALPLGNLRQSTSEPLTEIVWRVFPGHGEFSLVEDDGITPGAPRATTRVKVTPEGVEFAAREGDHVPPPRRRRVEVGERHWEGDDDGSAWRIGL